MNPFDKAIERRTEDAEFVSRVDAQALGQITLTFSDVLHRPGHQLQWLHQEANQQAEQRNNNQHGGYRGDQR
ncbi:hypothetical protein D3C84_924550 [compost metagenome]